ncbi:MAG: CsbD family protein [Bdellovibrionaceae bacterium]|nr:CsbD family protein [Pseudobdellovibrionaceae bacterium]
MINENIIKGKWKEIKGDLRKKYGQLTDNEIEETKGDMTRLAGLLQKKFGYQQEEARRHIDEFMRPFEDRMAGEDDVTRRN